MALCGWCKTEFSATAARRRFCKASCYHLATRQNADQSFSARFWAKVAISSPTACWLWQASTIRGYGQVHLPRTDRQHTKYAHRVAWELTNGTIADNHSVLHRCDTPLCCNPNHLFLGTQQDNLTDARQKGRLIDGAHRIRVSDAGLIDIRRRYRRRQNGRQLAAEYGVTLTTILRIVAGTQRVRHQPFQPSAAMTHQHQRGFEGDGRVSDGAEGVGHGR